MSLPPVAPDPRMLVQALVEAAVAFAEDRRLRAAGAYIPDQAAAEQALLDATAALAQAAIRRAVHDWAGPA